MILEEVLIAVIFSQIIFLPILGALWYGARAERVKNQRLLLDAIKTLQVVGISRGRHLK